MAFGAVEIAFWDDGPNTSEKGPQIDGKYISGASGANGSNTSIPGNATYVSLYMQADSYVLISEGSVTPAAGAGIPVPATTLFWIEIPDGASGGDWEIYYEAA